MDTSETYIKMCDKAEEIQKGKPQPLSYGDDIIYSGKDVHAELGRGSNALRWVWLPRQDQLQGMSNFAYADQFIELDVKLSRFMVWYDSSHRKSKGSAPHTSMEQLWLAFVMKEKFGKVWNGEDWKVSNGT